MKLYLQVILWTVFLVLLWEHQVVMILLWFFGSLIGAMIKGSRV